jgi:hypothetical protein
MSENVGGSTSRNPKGLHGLYGDNFTLPYRVLVRDFLLVLQQFIDVSEESSASFLDVKSMKSKQKARSKITSSETSANITDVRDNP